MEQMERLLLSLAGLILPMQIQTQQQPKANQACRIESWAVGQIKMAVWKSRLWRENAIRWERLKFFKASFFVLKRDFLREMLCA